MKNDFLEKLFEFYKDIYFYELERKDKLLQQVGLAIAILTIIGNLIGYFLKGFCLVEFLWSDLPFYSCFIVGLIFTVISFWFVVSSLSYGFYYGYISTPKEIQNALTQIDSYNETVTGKDVIDGENAFYINTIDQFTEYADRNFKNNTKRYGYIFWGFRYAIFALIALILAFPGYQLLNKRFPGNATTVNIKDEVKVKIMTDEQNQKQDNKPVEPKPVEKPEWPQGHLTKEADEMNVNRRVITEDQKE